MNSKNLYYQLKTSLYDTKENHQSVSSENLSETINSLDKDKIESGEINIYIEPKSRNIYTQKNSYWAIFDIESEKHFDIPKNVEAGKKFLIFCIEKGLLPGLVILLTGHGFRFCWQHLIPDAHDKGFKEFINDKTLPIDASIFKRTKFTRVLGYRGHPSQTKGKFIDAHIHMLNDPFDLFDLNEEKYLQLIKGKVSAETHLSWWEKIKPFDNSIPLPEPWINLLNGYAMDRKLKNSIFMPDYSIPISLKHGQSNKGIWEQIDTYLADINITIQKKTVSKDVIIFKLVCPICNRDTAYITERGVLKCFHIGGSCAAGKQGHSKKYGGDYTVGLKPHEWIPNFKNVGPPEYIDLEEEHKRVTIEKARKAITDSINEHCDVLISAIPGVGKTFSIMHLLIPTCKDRKILYAAPTTDLTNQVYEEAKTIGLKHDIPVYIVEGRNENNCQKFNKTQKVGKLGYSPGVLVCTTCPYKRNGCQYQAQSKTLDNKSGFFIATQQKISSREIEADNFAVVVYDENPTRVYVKSIKSSLNALLKIKTFEPAFRPESISCIDKMQKAIEECLRRFQKSGNKKGHDRLYLTPAPEGSKWDEVPDIWEQGKISKLEQDTLNRDLACFAQGEAESTFKWQERLYKNNINLKALNFLLTGLKEQKGFAYVKISLGDQPIEFFTVKKNVPLFLSGRTIVLDGTGNKPEMDSLFNRRFKFIDGNVPLPEDTKTVFIQRGLGKCKCIDLSDKNIKLILKRACEQLKPGDNKILLCTHKCMKKKVLKIAQKLLPGKTLEIIHYWGYRGKNEYEDFDAAISFGTTFINIEGALDVAQALFKKKEQRDNWFRIQGFNEVYQTVFRIRPLKANKTIIICGREWPPMLGNPNYIINLSHGQTKIEGVFDIAYNRIENFVLKHGFITKEIGLALGIGDGTNNVIIERILHYIKNEYGYTDQNVHPYHIKSIIDIGIQCDQSSSFKKNPILTIGRTSYWSELLSRLKLEFPNLPKFHERASGISEGKAVTGLGFRHAVEAFYKRSSEDCKGIEFREEKWDFKEEIERNERLQKYAGKKPRKLSRNKSVSFKAFMLKGRLVTISEVLDSMEGTIPNFREPNDFGLKFHYWIMPSTEIIQIE